MTSTHSGRLADGPGDGASEELRERHARLRVLRSAWTALAPAGLSAGGRRIGEVGRQIAEALGQLAERGEHAAALEALDARLDAFAHEMREVAFAVPVPQLRSTLPDRAATARRSLLDLLDVMIGPDPSDLDERRARIASLDYLITLLCTGGESGPQGAPIRHDPVTLTPRLHALCERMDVADCQDLAAAEAEFFAAAGMDAADLRAEIEHRALRQRKAALGARYFAPRVLRAVVTYNATLMQRIAEEVWDSQDWGEPATPSGTLPGASEAAPAAGSVFATPALSELAEALRRREAGEAPEPGPVDRVAWCLDLSLLPAGDRGMLLGPEAPADDEAGGCDAQAEPVVRIALLVGLLGRSLDALAADLPDAGIDPGRLAGEWLRELDAALQAEVNRSIAAHDYERACMLSELKGRFAQGAQQSAPRAARPPPLRRAAPQAPRERPEDARQTAKRLVREALDDEADPAPRAARRGNANDAARSARATQGVPGGASRDRVRLLRRSAAALALAVLGLQVVRVLPQRDLAGFAARDLAAVSPYLERGHRNGSGTGPAFVGRLDEAWEALAAPERAEAALQMVAALRARGVRDVMVYDDAGRLRLQALGSQPPQLMAAR